MQSIWVYDRPIDFDGVQQVHDNLQRGRLSRRIERSPLRFGRHRWISPNGSSAIEIAASGRPRAEFTAWLSEQASTPLDCERGPDGTLPVLPFTDGGTWMSLVVPHCLTDGIGLCEALVDAVHGRADPISMPPDRARGGKPCARTSAKPRAIPPLSGAPSWAHTVGAA